ncbi:MAG: tetratricopeptide repeat protein, partial [Pseudomonadota bacterium]|nr:tetratricopeptide repeat protein [Pseudomonadota bacterium]
MRTVSTLLLALVASLLAACASVPPPRFDDLLADRLFGPPTETISTADVFTVDAAMQHYLSVDIAAQLRSKGSQTGLIDALYKRSQLKLEYDSAKTKTAAEAFATRSGNCLSLVIMTAALARELHLPVAYQSAYLEETWSRSGDLMLASSHVNVTVGRPIAASVGPRDLSLLTIDFLPAQELRRMRTREISETTIVAMYANNRAAEALSQGRVDDAYAWTREALRQDPRYVGAYNTLGVVYLRRGRPAEAIVALSRALSIEPLNTRAMSNLAQGYQRAGRTAEADALRTRLAAIEPDP